ncbi:MAG: hypothetical protein KA312_01790 [Sphingorhabdus sp.]|nr:hypothetical protein [Sphingorhabdus sp.]MCC6482374.1 hypothetical protein [Sphingomonadaceae bacterium]
MLSLIPLISATVTPVVNDRAVYEKSTVVFFVEKIANQKIQPLANSSEKSISVQPSKARISSLLNRLRTLKKWPANWDSEGAKAPVGSAIDDATLFLSLWSSRHVPEVGLTHDGLPLFLVKTGNALGEIIINADSSIDYYFEYDDGRMEGDENLPFDKTIFPSQILASVA